MSELKLSEGAGYTREDVDLLNHARILQETEREEMENDVRVAKGATVWVADFSVLHSGLLCVEGVLKADIIGGYGWADVKLVAATLLNIEYSNIFLTEEEATAAGRVLVEARLLHLKAEYEKESEKYRKLLE